MGNLQYYLQETIMKEETTVANKKKLNRTTKNTKKSRKSLSSKDKEITEETLEEEDTQQISEEKLCFNREINFIHADIDQADSLVK
jgi:hypothetical protein